MSNGLDGEQLQQFIGDTVDLAKKTEEALRSAAQGVGQSPDKKQQGRRFRKLIARIRSAKKPLEGRLNS